MRERREFGPRGVAASLLPEALVAEPGARLITLLPKDCYANIIKTPIVVSNKYHWLSSHAIDFYYLITLISSLLTQNKCCSDEKCATMSGYSGISYRLPIDATHNAPYSVSAPKYIKAISEGIEKLINDDNKFIVEGETYPENFINDLLFIYTRLYRILAHIYKEHYVAIFNMGLNIFLDTIAIHFISFAIEFALIDQKEMQHHSFRAFLAFFCKADSKKCQIQSPIPINLVSSIIQNESEQQPKSKIASSDGSGISRLIKESISSFYDNFYGNNWVKYIEEHCRPRRKKTTLNDFDLLTCIGKGGYGIVRLCQYKSDPDHTIYAIKVIDKAGLALKNRLVSPYIERDTMKNICKSTWTVQLYETFQDKQNLYFVMEFCQAGDLMWWLENKNIFTEAVACFYIAELVLALKDLHKSNCIHRDVKPDNIFIDRSGHIKLADFGLATGVLRGSNDVMPRTEGQPVAASKTHDSMVGSLLYMAPEVVLKKPYDNKIDYWSLGVILYEMLYGRVPFYGESQDIVIGKIINWQHYLVFEDLSGSPVSELAKNLLRNLICDVEHRMNLEQIQQHDFFKTHGINWADLESKKMPAPFSAEISAQLNSATDTRYFGQIPTEPLSLASRLSSDGQRFPWFTMRRPPKDPLPDNATHTANIHN